MIRTLLSLWMILSTLGTSAPPELRTVFAMKTGILLRMHVVAHDDSDEMQRVKLCVRDAVRQVYASAEGTGTMLERTSALLPQLTQTARQTAEEEGFTGSVTVAIEHRHFDQRELDGLTIPEGEYPALMIRLGEAQGRNWWGLIDPELALACVRLGDLQEWDWSFAGFLNALLGWRVIIHE